MDYLTKDGARALAEKITTYWISRGYYGIDACTVEFKIPRRALHGDETSIAYRIATNIGPTGYPPKRRGEAPAIRKDCVHGP